MTRKYLTAALVITAMVMTSLVHTQSAEAAGDPPVCQYNQTITGCDRQTIFVDAHAGDANTYFHVIRGVDAWFGAECVDLPDGYRRACVLGDKLTLEDGVLPTYGFDVTPTPTPVPNPQLQATPELAFTGSETSVLGYVGASMIAFGAVALGSRRKYFAGKLD